MSRPIPTQIIPSVAPSSASESVVAREFRTLLRRAKLLQVDGVAKKRPERLFTAGYTPKHRVDLFGTRFYFTRVRQTPYLRFFVAFLVQPDPRSGAPRIYGRIVYKDLSLIWRCASHFVYSGDEFWVGKGAVTTVVNDGYELLVSVEATTDLPLEMQTAVETLNHRANRIREDEAALFRILRRAPSGRIEAYRDFTEPLQKARANPKNLINRGRSIARFAKKNDPNSLRIQPGFEPDFVRGILEQSSSTSSLYHGRVHRFRILSVNRQIQYMFFAGPKQVWLSPPQALTTELTTYGVRTVNVVAADDLFIPGYEYHDAEDEDGRSDDSQIPEGYAGAQSEVNTDTADASAWLDEIPLIQEFRRAVLNKRFKRTYFDLAKPPRQAANPL